MAIQAKTIIAVLFETQITVEDNTTTANERNRVGEGEGGQKREGRPLPPAVDGVCVPFGRPSLVFPSRVSLSLSLVRPLKR